MNAVYVAAPFEQRAFAALLASNLRRDANLEVTSRWLFEESNLDAEWAQKDLDDIDRADALVALNAESWKTSGTGGRHVELGYALAREKTIVLVGVRSNIFHYHPSVLLVSWHDALNLSAVVADALERAK